MLAEEGIALERIDASFVPNMEEGQRGPLARLFGRHLRITVALGGGSILVIDSSSEVGDRPGGGSVFAVTLPLAEQARSVTPGPPVLPLAP